MQIHKAAGALGAWVSGPTLAEVARDDACYQRLRAALVQHQVLFLRDQPVDPVAFAAFARRFGRLVEHPAYAGVDAASAVQILESTAERPSKIEKWHSDMTFSAAPPTFTMLLGDVIPAYGGDTLWASACAAYDGLSCHMRDWLDDLHAEHDFRVGFAESLAEPGGEERLAQGVADNPPTVHPLVHHHPESGRRALYVNALFTSRIVELEAAESRALLAFLTRHIVAEEFTVRLGWQRGTVALWDNRSTQHKPVNDFLPQHRRMLRVTVAADS